MAARHASRGMSLVASSLPVELIRGGRRGRNFASGRDRVRLRTAQELLGGNDSLLIIDADALIYKAHFAGSNMGLSNRKGVDTSATYVFTKSTLGLLKKQPAYVAMVTAGEAESNESATTFRHHMYSAYKANRQYNPNVERSKIECLQAASRMGIASISPEEVYPPIEGNGLEADDVIGVLAHRAEERGMRVSIVSPDKDFFQLLSPLVQLIRPTGRHGFEVFTEDNFRREYGLEPRQYVEILALSGDNSDNVPGVEGIGDKTAPALVRQHGSSEGALQAAREGQGVSPKWVQQRLIKEGAQERARLAKELVTLRFDVWLNFSFESLRWHPERVDYSKLRHFFFDELEFHSVAHDLKEVFGPGDAG